MTTAVTVQVLTLVVAAIAVGGASYAALLTGRFQRAAAERLHMWQRLEADRIRGLDQVRSAYEAEIVAVTQVEQLLWFAANRNLPPNRLTENYKEQVRQLVRSHAAQHGAVQLLGSKSVVEQADVVGRGITGNAFARQDRTESPQPKQSRTTDQNAPRPPP